MFGIDLSLALDFVFFLLVFAQSLFKFHQGQIGKKLLITAQSIPPIHIFLSRKLPQQAVLARTKKKVKKKIW